LAPFGFKVLVNRILIEAGRRLPPTFNYIWDTPDWAELCNNLPDTSVSHANGTNVLKTECF